jgi:hypothetical protein
VRDRCWQREFDGIREVCCQFEEAPGASSLDFRNHRRGVHGSHGASLLNACTQVLVARGGGAAIGTPAEEPVQKIPTANGHPARAKRSETVNGILRQFRPYVIGMSATPAINKVRAEWIEHFVKIYMNWLHPVANDSGDDDPDPRAAWRRPLAPRGRPPGWPSLPTSKDSRRNQQHRASLRAPTRARTRNPSDQRYRRTRAQQERHSINDTMVF